MKKSITLISFLAAANLIFAQMGIGTTSPNSSAQLEVSSTNKGVLLPRLTQTQINAISSPPAGLQVYNTTQNCINVFNGSSWTSEKKYIGKTVNQGVTVELDNLKIQIPSSGNRSLQIATSSGSATFSGTSTNNFNNSGVSGTGAAISLNSYHRQSESFGTTFSYWQSTANFVQAGSMQELWLLDETNSRAYHVKYIVGDNYLNNYLEIEQWL
jgi:hypothetical protein